MDTARNKHTFEPIEAEELWNMATVDSNAYICRGCTTQIFPASYDRERNKKRPYFTLGPNNKHKAGCDVDGEEKIARRAKKERVGNPEGFPLPFPNRLTMTDERPMQPNNLNSQASQNGGRSSSRSSGTGPVPKAHHGHTVKTIRPACRTFINFPNDREHLPLVIPGTPGNTYAKIFWYLGSKKPELFKTPMHLYYSAIRWKAEPVIEETHCELTLNAGEWNNEERVFKRLCRVRVNWSDWSRSRRDTLMREFNVTRAEAIEKAKDDSQTKGWLFFVGTQDEFDPSLFHVDNHRLICCLAANLIWPAKK